MPGILNRTSLLGMLTLMLGSGVRAEGGESNADKPVVSEGARLLSDVIGAATRGPKTAEIDAATFRAQIVSAFGSGFCDTPKRALKQMKKKDAGATEPRNGGTDNTDTNSTASDVEMAAWGGWVPRLVRTHLDERFLTSPFPNTPVKVLVANRFALQDLAFTIWFPTEPVHTTHALASSNTYAKGIDLIPFFGGDVVTGKDRLIYTLDCGGVLSAAVEATGGLASIGVSGKLKSMTARSQSRILVRGVLESPIVDAISGDGKRLDRPERIDILGALAIIAEGKPDDTQMVTAHKSDVVSLARADRDDFQGHAAGGVSLSIPGASGNVDAQVSVGRTMSVQQYDFYFRDEVVGQSFGVAKARDRLVAEIQSAPSVRTMVNATLVNVETAVPENLCEKLAWTALDTSTTPNQPLSDTSVDPEWKGDACMLTVSRGSALPPMFEVDGKSDNLLGSSRKVSLQVR